MAGWRKKQAWLAQTRVSINVFGRPRNPEELNHPLQIAYPVGGFFVSPRACTLDYSSTVAAETRSRVISFKQRDAATATAFREESRNQESQEKPGKQGEKWRKSRRDVFYRRVALRSNGLLKFERKFACRSARTRRWRPGRVKRNPRSCFIIRGAFKVSRLSLLRRRQSYSAISSSPRPFLISPRFASLLPGPAFEVNKCKIGEKKKSRERRGK